MNDQSDSIYIQNVAVKSHLSLLWCSAIKIYTFLHYNINTANNTPSGQLIFNFGADAAPSASGGDVGTAPAAVTLWPADAVDDAKAVFFPVAQAPNLDGKPGLV